MALVLTGVFAVSFLIVLPALVVLGCVGAYYYWRYAMALTTASEGEIGRTLQPLGGGHKGLVRFERDMHAGGMAFRTRVTLPCASEAPVAAGEAVVVVSVRGQTILVRKLED